MPKYIEVTKMQIFSDIYDFFLSLKNLNLKKIKSQTHIETNNRSKYLNKKL